MNGELWTKERDAALREMREQGYSFSQIAVKLGLTTRNAAIGRANRLRLPKEPRVRREKQSRVERHTPFRPPALKTEPLPLMDQQSDAPVTLLDLEPHHCRWPVSDAPYAFCGATKQDGSSYCGHHHRVAISSNAAASSTARKPWKPARLRASSVTVDPRP